MGRQVHYETGSLQMLALFSIGLIVSRQESVLPMAIDILTTPASLAPEKRVFSIAREIIAGKT